MILTKRDISGTKKRVAISIIDKEVDNLYIIFQAYRNHTNQDLHKVKCCVTIPVDTALWQISRLKHLNLKNANKNR
jgi:hypothetical protein